MNHETAALIEAIAGATGAQLAELRDELRRENQTHLQETNNLLEASRQLSEMRAREALARLENIAYSVVQDL